MNDYKHRQNQGANQGPGDAAMPETLPPSKTRVKREMHELLDLGRELVALSPARLDELPLADNLREAIALARRISSREGRRRQVHYVGKLMRQADVPAIRAQMEIWAGGARAEAGTLHRIENLRDRLLASDEALTGLLDSSPELDIQALRARIRAARAEARANQALPAGREPARKHYRALFQTLKNLPLEDIYKHE